MKKYISVLLLICLAGIWPSFAQKTRTTGPAATLSGVVSDNVGPLPGATVYLVNKDERVITGQVTGVQGEYILNIPSNPTGLTFVVGFVGYVTQRIPYTGQTRLNIRLAEETSALKSAYVDAKAGKRDITGVSRENNGTARETIDVTDLDDMSATSIEDMLQGKVGNLDIVSMSGDPGTASTIRIRGTASLNAGNEPLIVIDGIPQDNEIDEDFDFGDSNVENFGALLNMSPNDIQSIEVLKDAAATALWGSRAANGVILVTTRQGGQHKPKFSLTNKSNVTFQPKPIELLNGQEYVTLMQDAMWNWIKDGDFLASRVNKLNNQKDILYDRSYEYFNEFNCDTDWLDLVSRSTFNNTTDFSMSGGGDMANYRFSLGYDDQNGTTIGTDYSRITSRLNLTIKFSRKFRVDSKFSYTESDRNQPYGTTTSDLSTVNYTTLDQIRKPVRNTAMIKMPNMSPYLLDDNGNVTDEYFTAPESSLQGVFPNPLAHVMESTNETKVRAVGATFGFFYNPVKGLTITSNLSYNLQAARNNSFLPASVLNVKWNNTNYNQGVEAQANKTTVFGEVRVNYSKNVKKHSFLFTASDQIEASNNNNYSITTSGSGAKQVSSPSSEGRIVSMSSGSSKKRTVGIMGSFNYVYDERYALNFAGRMNANSNTGRSGRWSGIRPSLSGVWRINNEKFMKKMKNVNELRARVSWGKSDRVPNSSYVTGTFANETEYMDYSAIKPSKMQIDNLRPEIVTQLNAGIDGSLFKNRVSFTFDWYNKQTKDLLMQNMNIQSTTGYNTIRWYNAGDVRNRGWEFTLNLNNIIRKDGFRLSLTNLNISRNINEITHLPETMVAEKYTLGNGNYARKIIEGSPIGSIFGYIFDGIYQNYEETLARDADGNLMHDINGDTVPMTVGGTTRMHPGDTKYRDINYDGIIDENDIVYLGSSYPTVTGGGTVVLNYKNWQLRASTHFRLGQSIINMTRHDLEKMSNANNQSKAVLNRWRYEGDDTDIPRALWGTNYNSMGCSKFVEDGSFFKIKDITLRYTLSDKVSAKLGISKASVYVTTYNLVTFTKYTGQDPEIGVESGAYGLAIDNSKTPPSKRIAVGFSIDF